MVYLCEKAQSKNFHQAGKSSSRMNFGISYNTVLKLKELILKCGSVWLGVYGLIWLGVAKCGSVWVGVYGLICLYQNSSYRKIFQPDGSS